MHRRNFLRATVVGSAAAAFGGAAWLDAFASGARRADGPYGPLEPADGNGVRLPKNFTSQIVARTGENVEGTDYTWHPAPDGGACFADGSDPAGWIYVSNSEVSSSGGVGAIRFAADGSIVDAYRTLDGTDLNCAGGATPWNTWLSCEEVSGGQVYETDPWGQNEAVVRPAMGTFKHEACAVDPVRKVVYMTEDVGDGNFYRFTPTTWEDLSAGKLEALVADADEGPVTWEEVPDALATRAETRYQVAAAKAFDGGEGCYYADDTCWFTTKGDNRVWAYDAANESLSLTYDASEPLSGVDNVTGSASGDLFVAEDGGNLEICIITPDGEVAPFVEVTESDESEITGPAFSPDGKRLYFSSQRGTSGSSDGGITYEVTGPFRS